MDERWTRLAALAVHGANVQPGQIVMVSAELGHEELARAVAAAAYDRGAKFVDVVYFDPYLKRARVQQRRPGDARLRARLVRRADARARSGKGARVTIAGPTEPNLLDDLDKTLVGKDRLPWLKEIGKVVGERSDELVDRPGAASRLGEARLSGPAPRTTRTRRLWRELEHVLRLDEPDPAPAWEERMDVLNDSAKRLSERPLRRDRAARARHRADRRHAPDAHVVGGRLHDGRRPAPLPEPADRGGLHDAGSDSARRGT